MILLILIVAAAVAAAWAVYAHYSATPTTDSVPQRLWASIIAGGLAIAAAIQAWLHGVTAP